jgi:hypothetical protein
MMIHNEEEYKTTLERISQFQKQVEHLRGIFMVTSWPIQ